MGGRAADAERDVQAGALEGDGRSSSTTSCSRRSPSEARPRSAPEQIVERVGDFADRVCLYFPGFPIADDVLGELVSAIKSESAALLAA